MAQIVEHPGEDALRPPTEPASRILATDAATP
jgi:hypothetical protein